MDGYHDSQSATWFSLCMPFLERQAVTFCRALWMVTTTVKVPRGSIYVDWRLESASNRRCRLEGASELQSQSSLVLAKPNIKPTTQSLSFFLCFFLSLSLSISISISLSLCLHGGIEVSLKQWEEVCAKKYFHLISKVWIDEDERDPLYGRVGEVKQGQVGQ